MRRAVYDEFYRGLAAYGYIDGQTIRIHHCRSERDYAKYPELVKQLTRPH